MREYLSSLIYNETWTLVDLPPGWKAIRCGWIYKAKKTEQGAVYRLPYQKLEIDYNDTFAPFGHMDTKRFSVSYLVFPFILDINFFI